MTRGWRVLSLAGPRRVARADGRHGRAGMMVMLSRQARSVPVETRVAAYVLRELDRRSDPKDARRRPIVTPPRSCWRRAIDRCSPTRRIYAPERFLLLTPAHKTLADRILRRPVDRADGGRGGGEARRAEHARGGRTIRPMPPISAIALMLFYGTLTSRRRCSALVAALATRGVMLRLLGFEIVTADGRLAPRWRVLARAAIAWSPLLRADRRLDRDRRRRRRPLRTDSRIRRRPRRPVRGRDRGRRTARPAASRIASPARGSCRDRASPSRTSHLRDRSRRGLV